MSSSGQRPTQPPSGQCEHDSRTVLLASTVLGNPWIPHEPSPKQAAFLTSPEREVFYGGAAGGGKALDCRTLIPMPFPGPPVALGSLRPGDRVIGSDGGPLLVLAVSDVMEGHPCYRVAWEGGSVVADAEHLWRVVVEGGGPALATTEALAACLRRGGRVWVPSLSGVSPPDTPDSVRPILGCDPCPSVPVRCIKVAAADGLFALASGVLTHNTDALLMGALQYAEQPGYAALILMRTFSDLALPKVGISRSKEWLAGTGAKWHDDTKTWTFPSGATLTFGYLEHEDDKFRYRGPEFSYIAFDELTRFTETQYTYLISRLRRLKGTEIPSRVRSASNPGDRGHDWVKRRFIPDDYLAASEGERFARVWGKGGRLFIPARLEDNAALDHEDYELSLAELDPVTRAQLRHGDWQAHADGRFQRGWFRTYRDMGDAYRLVEPNEVVHKAGCSRVVVVDPANRKTKASKYTSILVAADLGKQRLAVLEVIREQLAIGQIISTLDGVCARWAPSWVGIEANGFQLALVEEARSGKHRNIPTVRELEPEGKSKLTRATPAIIRAEHGRIFLPEAAPWLDSFTAELCQFTGDERLDAYTDQVDTLAYAVRESDRLGDVDDGPVLMYRRGG